jgi:hypothetical protein
MEATSTISPVSTSKKSKKFPIWNVLFIVVLVIAFGALVYLFMAQKKKVDALEQAQKAAAVEAISNQTKEAEVQNAAKFAAYQALYAKRLDTLNSITKSMTDKLSPQGQKDFQLIIVKVGENPELLGLSVDRYPTDVQAAIANVKKELYAESDEQSYGDYIPADKFIKKDGTSGANVKVGDRGYLAGTLEVSSEDGPLGTVFKIFDEKYQAPFFFTFNDTNTTNAMKLVGEDVQFEVEITKVVTGKGVLYKVVSGPKAV